jgi:histidinol-phosphate phosphatase family protein
VSRPAVFLDRDGTINHDTGYVSDAAKVEILPGVAAAIRRLNERNIPVVVITNQSGIARGLITVASYEAVRARIDELLAAEGASVTATYACPHHPDFTGPCECRKPGTLLFRQAAEELQLDLSRSFFIGDRIRDISPALVFGGTGILVPSTDSSPEDRAAAQGKFPVYLSLDEAVSRVIESTQ